jgi:hypothetical protein
MGHTSALSQLNSRVGPENNKLRDHAQTVLRHAITKLSRIMRGELEDDAFVFDVGVKAEIHQEAERVTSGVQVIVDLSAML